METINKIKENKAIKIIGNILYYILFVLILLILIVVILQRVTNNNVAVGGIRIFNIVTESMTPEYNIGDILVSKTTDFAKIEFGDDIVYLGEKGELQGKIITHRVVQIDKDGETYKFHTKGIANTEEDPVVDESQVYGIIIYKTYILSFISKIINNLYGFYFLIFIPLTILIIVKFIKIKQENDDTEEEIDNLKNKDKKEETSEENKR